MTHAKLKHKIIVIDIFLHNLEGKTLEAMADEVIDAAYAALKEPTEVMMVAGCQADDPLGGLVNWTGENCTTREAVTNVFQAMLTASLLAPEGGRTI